MGMVIRCSRVVIAPTSASIKAGGQAGEPLKLTLDIYPDDGEQVMNIFDLRGKELVVVLATVDQSDSPLLTEQNSARNGKHPN